MFLQRVAATPDTQAFGGPGPDGTPVWFTWRQISDRASAIAAGLTTLGVGSEERVAILASTRLDWVVTDLGIMCAGGATTTVYPTTEPEDACFIVSDSGSTVLFAENPDQAAKMDPAAVPALRQIILFDGEADPEAAIPQITLAELELRGAGVLAERPGLVSEIVAGIEPSALATLIYTSGTTGRPKGVELLHRGWCWEGVAQGDVGVLLGSDTQFLWLPLSHSFGKTLLCGIIHVGVPTYVDGRVDKIIDNLALIKPTLMCAAPRIFEKVYNRVVTQATSAGGAKAKIFGWAVRTGKAKLALEQAGKPVPGGLNFKYGIAHKLVFSKLHERLGGNIRYMVSGSAPLSVPIAEFFAAAGLPVSEGYGLTESSAGNTVNRPGALKIGTVGPPLADLEVKIDTDGEILLRGAPVMRGYHNLPEETKAVFTEEGFFRTGDIGEIDADGHVKITDRKKDLVKTSGGKYIAPSHIEGLFKALCPLTSQVLVIGQARNYVTMVITLDPESVTAWAANGPLAGKPYAEIVASSEAEAYVGGFVKELNTKVNRWETIKKFIILPRDLTIEDGEITPSLKLKRRVVEENFKPQIEAMYAGSLAEI
ncbi:long-chain acyl-CoA synthetase [Allocatelliglobosispora scoriae]|uniref:Long-chain acyl-CoA synthetase n=2 Tax=Allocatelliglobosispora scoriae TaxID=643052 RepID=A0A841BPV7_9ACTN|nr:long-chain acyl-CoA synthetase [Allocatelliglobosispora scoriae]